MRSTVSMRPRRFRRGCRPEAQHSAASVHAGFTEAAAFPPLMSEAPPREGPFVYSLHRAAAFPPRDVLGAARQAATGTEGFNGGPRRFRRGMYAFLPDVMDALASGFTRLRRFRRGCQAGIQDRSAVPLGFTEAAAFPLRDAVRVAATTVPFTKRQLQQGRGVSAADVWRGFSVRCKGFAPRFYRGRGVSAADVARTRAAQRSARGLQ